MNIEPVRYSRLIMQLIAPTPMNAVRQARSASPSSERRTPGTADINSDLFQRVRVPNSRGDAKSYPTDFSSYRLLMWAVRPPELGSARFESKNGCQTAN